LAYFVPEERVDEVEKETEKEEKGDATNPSNDLAAQGNDLEPEAISLVDEKTFWTV
jgi:hypothetical protein